MIPVSVIIPTHNRRDLVVEAVARLDEQEYPRSLLQVVVATDRCTDGTAAALRSRFGDRITLIDSSRPGSSAALNAGTSAATGELAIFLDDEMLPVPAFVAMHAKAHAAAVTPIAVTGYSPVAEGQQTPLASYVARNYRAFFQRLESRPESRDPRYLMAGNMSIRVDALRAAGGFNESYFFQRNDFELAARLIERGYELRYCPSARADQQIAVDADSMVARAEPRAETDVRLVKEFPWCREFLPFSRQLSTGPAQARWKAAWAARGILPGILRSLRLVSQRSLFLVRYEYAVRYAIHSVRSAGGWDEWRRLGATAG